jgi:hypothetical protein
LRYKRSEALPDFTIDSAKGVLVADAVSPASLTSSFSRSLTAADTPWLRAAVTGGQLGFSGFDRCREAARLWRGGFHADIKGVYPGPCRLPKVIVRGTHALKAKLGLKTHLTHAGIDYGGYVTRMARPSLLGEYAWALRRADFWAVDIALAVGLNVLDYGWGSKADVGIGSTEFYAAVTVDVAIEAAGAGAGAITGYGFYLGAMWLCPQFAIPALVLGYLVGETSFSIVVAPSWREPGIEAVNWLYSQATAREAKIVYCGGPLLR